MILLWMKEAGFVGCERRIFVPDAKAHTVIRPPENRLSGLKEER